MFAPVKSIYAVVLVSIIWFLAGTFYYPKWNKSWSEATISWDVSGYYHYLPAIFIYKDLKQQIWLDSINQRYLPSPAYDQAFVHEKSGNKINKYAIGQAVLYSPFFLLAHTYAKLTNIFPADGYSKPYQFSIWFGSLLFSILGLFLLKEILGQYFSDSNTCWTILALGLGTHWLEYASISNGMNHTWLFTLLCSLILFTIRFYNRKDWISVTGIGASLGLAVLTRPTEIIWVLVPFLWGMNSIKGRLDDLIRNYPKVIIAFLITGAIMSIQFIYWKYVSGEWIVYSYRDQGFDWFHPKIWRGLMGVKIGWWIYTPLMFIAMFGWPGLYKKYKNIFWAVFFTSMLGLYLTVAWGHFESGGGLGQRNLIQIYPLLAFPLTIVIAWLTAKPLGKWVWIALLVFNIYYSSWWIHQAHKGGAFVAGQMTFPYFYHVVLKPQFDRDLYKLLDTNEYFNGAPQNLKGIFQTGFETDSLVCQFQLPESSVAACLNAEVQFLGPYTFTVNELCTQWLRMEGDFMVMSREYDIWKNAQWVIRFKKGEEVIKTNFIRLQRLLPEDNKLRHIFFDVKIPNAAFDVCDIIFWNADSHHTILIDNLKVSCFEE